MNCFDCLKDKKIAYFIGGVVTAIVGTKIAKSKKTRELCVSGLAKGMKLQKDAESAFQSMKEDAQDLCYEARVESGLIEEDK